MMKNRKGSTLVLVLMVFSVLMIFATFTVGFMVTENKQSLYHQHKTQAYYIARGGAEAVEAAILKMDVGQLGKLNDELDDKDEVKIGEIDIDEYKTNVVLKKDGNELSIESVASVDGVTEKVTKVMGVETTTSKTVEIDKAVFSHGDMTISNGTINGDIGTNGDIIISGNPTINGSAYLQSKDDFVISQSGEWWKTNWENNGYSVEILDREVEFPDYIFPQVPQNSSTLDDSPKIISQSKDYNVLTVNGTLEIDSTDNEILLNVNNLYLQSGKIAINGNNKITIFAKKITKQSGGFDINSSGNPKLLDIFYYGDNDLNINNNMKMAGNIFIKNAKLFIEGGSIMNGSIISSGGDITQNNGSATINSLIYAPNSKVDISGGAKINGAIIADTFSISNDGSITYDFEHIDTSLINVESSTSSSTKYKPGYFK